MKPFLTFSFFQREVWKMAYSRDTLRVLPTTGLGSVDPFGRRNNAR
jgi:hypothetical protein